MKRPREVEKKEQGRVEGQEGDDVLASKARKVSLFQITYEFASSRLTEKKAVRVTVKTGDSFLFKLEGAELVVERLGELGISQVDEDEYSLDEDERIQTFNVKGKMTFRCNESNESIYLTSKEGKAPSEAADIEGDGDGGGDSVGVESALWWEPDCDNSLGITWAAYRKREEIPRLFFHLLAGGGPEVTKASYDCAMAAFNKTTDPAELVFQTLCRRENHKTLTGGRIKAEIVALAQVAEIPEDEQEDMLALVTEADYTEDQFKELAPKLRCQWHSPPPTRPGTKLSLVNNQLLKWMNFVQVKGKDKVSFQQLRSRWSISDQEMHHSLGVRHMFRNLLAGEVMLPTTVDNVAGGSSGSTMYHSHDGRFVIKSLCQTRIKDEPEYWKTIKDKYIKYCLKQGSRTLLPRIVSTGSIDTTQYLIMANVFGTELPDHVFDLKGSSENRLAEGDASVKKDENFKLYIRNCPIDLPQDVREKLADQLERDVGFLLKNKRTDYSLLVGVVPTSPSGDGVAHAAVGHQDEPLTTAVAAQDDGARQEAANDEVEGAEASQLETFFGPLVGPSAHYYFGIIDILQPVDTVKWLEIAGKSFSGDVSAAPPKQFARRFLLKMREYLGLEQPSSPRRGSSSWSGTECKGS